MLVLFWWGNFFPSIFFPAMKMEENETVSVKLFLRPILN